MGPLGPLNADHSLQSCPAGDMGIYATMGPMGKHGGLNVIFVLGLENKALGMPMYVQLPQVDSS